MTERDELILTLAEYAPFDVAELVMNTVLDNVIAVIESMTGIKVEL